MSPSPWMARIASNMGSSIPNGYDPCARTRTSAFIRLYEDRRLPGLQPLTVGIHPLSAIVSQVTLAFEFNLLIYKELPWVTVPGKNGESIATRSTGDSEIICQSYF